MHFRAKVCDFLWHFSTTVQTLSKIILCLKIPIHICSRIKSKSYHRPLESRDAWVSYNIRKYKQCLSNSFIFVHVHVRSLWNVANSDHVCYQQVSWTNYISLLRKLGIFCQNQKYRNIVYHYEKCKYVSMCNFVLG